MIKTTTIQKGGEQKREAEKQGSVCSIKWVA